MNALPLLLPLLSTLAWTAGFAIAQAPGASPAPAERTLPFHIPPRVIPIHTAEPDGGIEYGLWGRGERYKASFHGDMTFVPYLGALYPHNQPWSFRTTSVRASGVELLAPGAVPQRQHSEYRAEYRYGPVTEAYDLRLEGLEQTFVFERAPAVAGDLVVTGVVTTGLQCATSTGTRAALEFVDEAGERILSYGAATVVDGAGRKATIETAWSGGELRLTVPGDWLAGATYPVTIDPLLGTLSILSNDVFHDADVARDDVLNQLFFACVSDASATDRDLNAYVIPDDFTATQLIFTDINTWDSQRVQVAIAGNPTTYCCVLNRIVSGVSGIRVHRHIGTDTTLGTNVQTLVSPSGAQDWRADVGGQRPYPAPGNDDTFLVVWQRDYIVGAPPNSNTSSIWARTMTTATTGGASVEFPIAVGVTISLDYEYPSVNQEARWVPGTGTQWLVTYQKFVNSSNLTWLVEGRLANDTATINSNTWQASGNGPLSHRMKPQVGGSFGRYLVAFTDATYAYLPVKTQQTNGLSLKTERVDWSGSGAPVNNPEHTIFGPYAANRMILGSVAYDYLTQSHWCVISGSAQNAGGTGRTIVNRVGYHGDTTESATLEAAAITQQGEPGGCCFDDDSSDFLCSWSMNTSSAGHAALRRFYYTSPLAVTQNGTACSTASIGWSGSQQIGSEFNAATLSGAPANSLAILAVAWAPLSVDLTVIGMTGCWLNVVNAGPDFLGTVTASISAAGTASVSLPLPEYLDPAELWFQWFVLQLNANPLHLVSTKGLRVPIVK